MPDPPRPEALAFAVITVAGATRAGADHGDAAALQQLQAFYARCSKAVSAVNGRIVKTLGDGLLASFPIEALRDVAAALREVQAAGTAEWQAYDSRCRVQVRLGTGTVLAGVFGPPGQESYDIYGNALSQLFKLPPGDFVPSPDATRRLGLPRA
jgi:class 3 adenylate cyclase